MTDISESIVNATRKARPKIVDQFNGKSPLWEGIFARPKKLPWHICMKFEKYKSPKVHYWTPMFRRKKDRDDFEREIVDLYNRKYR